jgi:hypothetical protein
MNLLTKLKLRLKSAPKSNHTIIPAFTIGGVEYFQFDDAFNLPYLRGLTTITYFREMQMNCDRDLLLAHCDAKETISKKLMEAFSIQAGKMNLTKIFDLQKESIALDMQLKERVTMITDPDLIYKLASIVFFDKNESPYNYEHSYNLKKIEFWKKHKTMHDFFLSMPVQKLVPFLKTLPQDMSSSSMEMEAMETAKKITIANWEHLSSHLSQEQRMKYVGKLIGLQENVPN